jgi:hypothetical protein
VLTAWVIGPFDFDLAKAMPLEKNADPAVAVVVGKQRLSWRELQADMGGKGFDLRLVLGQEPASGYLLTYVFSPKQQKVQLQFQSEEKVNLWHNGAPIETKRDATPLTLEQGWNALLLRLNNAEGSPFVSARILGGDGIRVSLQKE